MNKKTIIHFIFSLGRGGAETMLVHTLKELSEFNNVVITLHEDHHFKNELAGVTYICFNKRSLWWLPINIFQFRRLIKKLKPALVHSHLVIPTFVARLATPKKISLVSTIHTSVAHVPDYKKGYIKWLEIFTYRFRKSIIIGVSKISLQEYFNFLKVKPYKNYVLYTFVKVTMKNTKSHVKENNSCFKIIAVGALRPVKNYFYILEAFKTLGYKNIELHIYGKGPQQNRLQNEIDRYRLKIILKGQVNNIEEVLPEYDLFIMSSSYEGFSLSVLEAMSQRLPLLLSNIPSFNEQCENGAVYFELNNVNDLVQKIKWITENPSLLSQKAEESYDRVMHHFTLAHYMEGLRKIYSEALNENS